MTWEELKDESTPDLIDYVKSVNDPGYKDLAEAAFIALTFRFRKDLIDKCVIMSRKWQRTEDDAIELVNRVFNRFWQYPRYEHSECKDGNTDKCFRKYLYGIANREIVKLYNPSYSPYDGTEKVITSLIDPSVNYEPERLKILQEYEKKLDQAFAKLPPKHKIIYLTYKQHEKEGKNLPRHLTLELREAVGGLSQNTIRIYKMEANELMRKEFGNG
ncbi:sigma-70 family RNA polymerase sigma factor [Adhaeribacter swui]|uniref:Sigma-70 family RNA polymerase sigma factor n=1 Tax=Adhaeribacter swui TaxID=2086471 RepID=A0A7G7GB77_9BACT|nr:sigma-70 family RNA polymerase sigma factor [Adhaeribacter swui]QNF34411.1 sigma-70 family RNA polymerase sigma factor [Adhaeribacter swui]